MWNIPHLVFTALLLLLLLIVKELTLNLKAMKLKKMCLWTAIFLPVILFATYLFNAVTGGIATAMGAGSEFFLGSYCIFGIAFFVISITTCMIISYKSVKPTI